jgi:hypothetical protein
MGFTNSSLYFKHKILIQENNHRKTQDTIDDSSLRQRGLLQLLLWLYLFLACKNTKNIFVADALLLVVKQWYLEELEESTTLPPFFTKLFSYNFVTDDTD